MTPDYNRAVSVLLVEDNPGDAKLFKLHLDTSDTSVFPPAEVTHVDALEPAFDELERDSYDVVLLDLGLPRSSGLRTLERYLDASEERDVVDRPPVVVLTGLDDESVAMAAIERGAQDYLVKDELGRRTLNRSIRHAIERHEQQQELHRQNERLEQFASVVSHDLRNPLGIASGRLDLLAQGVESEHIEPIERAHDRMKTLLDDLLTLARNDRTVEEAEQLNLEQVSNRAWDQVETEDAELVCAEDRTVEADSSRCQQLLENLFRNAIDHGGGDVTVRVGSLPDGFYVEDDGPGIPADDRDDVFAAGYTTTEDGTGFGLNIVKEIAEAHSWNLGLTDGTDGGARFEFTGIKGGR